MDLSKFVFLVLYFVIFGSNIADARTTVDFNETSVTEIFRNNEVVTSKAEDNLSLKTCEDAGENSCKNQGTCEVQGDKKFCSCRAGTSGDFCQFTGEDCETFSCGENSGAECTYDIDQMKPVCKCIDERKDYDEEDKMCKEDFCKRVCGSSPRVACWGDISKESSVRCDCKDTADIYVPSIKDCKKACRKSGNYACQNGGTCDDETKLCSCLNGTSGDFCLFVDECYTSLKECAEASDARCVYNVTTSETWCECKTDGWIYDHDIKQCRIKYCEEACGTSGDVVCERDPMKRDIWLCTCFDPSKDFDAVDKTCKHDKCLEVCGVRYGVNTGELTCQGDPFKNVTCACSDPRKTFDFRDKECKTRENPREDLCKEVCGNKTGVICFGNITDRYDIICGCRDYYKNFDKRTKECKNDIVPRTECEAVCGTSYDVSCVERDNRGSNITVECICKDTNKEFDYWKKECYATVKVVHGLNILTWILTGVIVLLILTNCCSIACWCRYKRQAQRTTC